MTDVKQLVFFDFEMLCSKEGMPFANMESIRLGAVKYDLVSKEISYFDEFIKPTQTEPLSSFCKNLTHIDDEDLASAQTFPVVLRNFIHWAGSLKTSRFFSWSSNDISRLELDSLRHNLPHQVISALKSRYIDFQAIFTKRVSKINLSVENALSLYNLEFVGEKHNPMYDAYNTLRIYLCFHEEIFHSELLMLKHFIFIDREIPLNENINKQVKLYLKKDLQAFFNDIPIISNIRTGKKLLKQTSKLVKKYENILLNRAQLFHDDLLLYVRLLVQFYYDLLGSYNKHYSYGCKILILHEHMTTPLKQLTA